MSETKLEPCPFCGGTQALAEAGGRRVFCGGTDGCGAMTWVFTTEAEAIAAWNRRAAAPATREEAEAIAVEIEGVAEDTKQMPECRAQPGWLRTLAKRVRALPGGDAGWVTVTDDPATWPPDSGCECIAEHAGGNVIWERAMLTARRLRVGCDEGARGFRWMPWPAAARGEKGGA